MTTTVPTPIDEIELDIDAYESGSMIRLQDYAEYCRKVCRNASMPSPLEQVYLFCYAVLNQISFADMLTVETMVKRRYAERQQLKQEECEEEEHD